ncbi:hypothetical protein HYX11_04935 [Candidatus Woesearchaeota archaeon]|nr:hypothetical protein [Candidatus Woesearchaeota archaeon]
MQVDDIKDRKNIELYVHKEYGKIVVPSIPHKDREYGGHLMISPYEKVHHMNELFWFDSKKFYGFNALCAVAEKAMLELIDQKLPDGIHGVINYFEAGNWQFHTDRNHSREYPAGIPKDARCKIVHVHMYGRSPLEPSATEEDKILHWGWGEAPYFPRFHETPFAPPKQDKKWIVPDQFNSEEVDFFKMRLTELSVEIIWP